MYMVNRLKDLREDSDKNQEVLANYLNVTQATYSRYENEQIEIPLQSLVALARYYHTSLDYLLGLTDVRKPYPRCK